MNRQEIIDKIIGDLDIGQEIIFNIDVGPINGMPYKRPIKGKIVDMHLHGSVNFKVDCIDADGKKFTYVNANKRWLDKEQ